jgi:hypothetical protein
VPGQARNRDRVWSGAIIVMIRVAGKQNREGDISPAERWC